MYEKCCVKGCLSSTSTKRYSNDIISFHKFPNVNAEKAKWVLAIRVLNIQEFVAEIKSRICSKHFTQNDFRKVGLFKRQIKQGSVPSIFPYLNPEESENVEILEEDMAEFPEINDEEMYQLNADVNADIPSISWQMYNK